MRIPVSGPSQVADGTGATVASTTLTNTLPGIDGSSAYSIAFIATLPAVGYATYFITPASNAEDATPQHVDVAGSDVVVDNGVFSITISGANGRIISVDQDATGDVISFTQVPSLHDVVARGFEVLRGLMCWVLSVAGVVLVEQQCKSD